ncbi:MAG: hypothetical protein ABI859_18450, partial [Pseudomonadota bacterium]
MGEFELGRRKLALFIGGLISREDPGMRGKRTFGNRPRRQADEVQSTDPQAARMAIFALLARRDF